jgi:hypothetical protein
LGQCVVDARLAVIGKLKQESKPDPAVDSWALAINDLQGDFKPTGPSVEGDWRAVKHALKRGKPSPGMK